MTFDAERAARIAGIAGSGLTAANAGAQLARTLAQAGHPGIGIVPFILGGLALASSGASIASQVSDVGRFFSGLFGGARQPDPPRYARQDPPTGPGTTGTPGVIVIDEYPYSIDLRGMRRDDALAYLQQLLAQHRAARLAQDPTRAGPIEEQLGRIGWRMLGMWQRIYGGAVDPPVDLPPYVQPVAAAPEVARKSVSVGAASAREMARMLALATTPSAVVQRSAERPGALLQAALGEDERMAIRSAGAPSAPMSTTAKVAAVPAVAAVVAGGAYLVTRTPRRREDERRRS